MWQSSVCRHVDSLSGFYPESCQSRACPPPHVATLLLKETLPVLGSIVAVEEERASE